ncbi:HIT domain-containing protein [Profundibacterium mesophilum]|uniref:Histidine triad protein n=1 Tax=Profundibacterium mesophilum KAUST100406-0324 TaxID=1037889 RepID=A0A921TD80_9RHOB|nr:HIT domain-containing protein [Profundibacterium mesophilum]KAF0675852.1 putative Histidine triad protein [Profundibacterium mesophilum KAUST100406-0324]
MHPAYDDQNIFAKILRGEIPNDTVMESEHTLAFNDIAPQAPVHVLVIPRKPYLDQDDFFAHASAEEIVDFARLVAEICKQKNLSPGAEGSGYRTITNAGKDGIQEVPHYHLHILGGRRLGRMLAVAE